MFLETFISILKNAAVHTLLQCLSKTVATLLFVATFHKHCKENTTKQKTLLQPFQKAL